MRLSYVIVTHNRRDALVRTLLILPTVTPLPADQYEIWVVDNGSTDGTGDLLRREFPHIRLMERPANEGAAARSHAFGPSRGQYLILLDDDSYPIDSTVADSLAYMDTHRRSAALVGKVLLPDGKLEACAMPAVMLSGAVCLRRAALEQVGPFRPEFFRKAGEYDLSFRLWQAGWSVDRFEDVVYRHDKVMTGRSSDEAHFMDLRNNLILIERYLPRPMRQAYRKDWLRRYARIAHAAGCDAAISRAVAEARQWARRERETGRQILGESCLETLFEWQRQRRAVAAWARRLAIGTVAIADYSKTIYATWRAARLAGLQIRVIADNGRAFAGEHYRSVPIAPDPAALSAQVDGVILSNINPAQIDDRLQSLSRHFDGPILRLWHPRLLSESMTTQAAG